MFNQLIDQSKQPLHIPYDQPRELKHKHAERKSAGIPGGTSVQAPIGLDGVEDKHLSPAVGATIVCIHRTAPTAGGDTPRCRLLVIKTFV